MEWKQTTFAQSASKRNVAILQLMCIVSCYKGLGTDGMDLGQINMNAILMVDYSLLQPSMQIINAKMPCHMPLD